MKNLLFILLFLLAISSSAQHLRKIPDKELNKVIIESVLRDGYTARPLYIYNNSDDNAMVAYLYATPSDPFWRLVRQTFYISEPWVLKHLILNTYILDSTVQTSNVVHYLGNKTYRNMHMEKMIGTNPAVDLLYILFDESRGKCVVIFNLEPGLTKVARIDRIKNRWKVVEMTTTAIS